MKMPQIKVECTLKLTYESALMIRTILLGQMDHEVKNESAFS